MTIAQKLTRAIEERQAWRGGMLRTRDGLSIRSVDHRQSGCGIAWHIEGDGASWHELPDESWLIDLDDAATVGVLWALLCEAVRDRNDLRIPTLGESDVGWQRIGPPTGRKRVWEWEDMASIAEALLTVWGVS